MKIKHLLLLGAIVVFGSCTSAYRIGQTPDDVYYSPAPPQEEYVTADNQQDRDSYAYNNSDNIQDLAIRRGINDPQFRSNFSLYLGSGYYPYSSFEYPYNSFGSSFYSPYNSYYTPYMYTGVSFYPYNNYYNSFYSPYNNYYSPYYNSYYPPLYYITKPGIGSSVSNYRGPRQYNLGAYNVNTNRTISPGSTPTNSSVPVRTFRQQTNGTGVGNLVRRIFTPSGNNSTRRPATSSRSDNYNNNNNNNTRTFQPSTSSGNNSSPSSSGSSSGSAPVRTFRR